MIKMTEHAAELQALFGTVWAKCWRERLCVDYFGCTPYVEACVKIIERSGTYYLQLSMLGQSVEYKLASLCYPAYSIGIGTLEVCTRDLSIDTVSKRISFNLLVKLCIGKWGVEKCWKLAEERVSISWLTIEEIMKIDPNFVFDTSLLQRASGSKGVSSMRPEDYKIYLDDNSEQYE